VVNGEMSLRRLKLSMYEVVTPREEGPLTSLETKLDGISVSTNGTRCTF
jgi:hypothetical protein